MVDQVVTPAAPPAPGTPEYDAAMAAKFDNVGITPHANADTPVERPAEVPEKFWDAKTGQVNYAAWSKSTTELEAALTKSRQQPTPPIVPAVDPVKVHADGKAVVEAALVAVKAKAGVTPEEITAAEKAVADYPKEPAKADVVDKTLAEAGLKMDEFRAEFAEHSKLSDVSYAKLEKAGITRDIVDNYIAGQQAIANEQRTTAFGLVGGEDNYTKMVTWAASLTLGEKQAFNSALEGTPEARALAITGMNQRYIAANGFEPTLLGGNGGGTALGGFRSNAEMVAAINDPRYEKDPAYRKDVETRIHKSNY